MTRILVMGDTHCQTWDEVHPGIREMVPDMDIVVHCGDLTKIAVAEGLRKAARRAVVVHGNSDPPDITATLPKQELFEIEGKRIARQNAPIEQHGRTVGAVTSGTISPTLGKIIAMGFVDARLSEPDTDLKVDIRGVKTAARVVPLPFFKRPKKQGFGARRSGEVQPIKKTGLT